VPINRNRRTLETPNELPFLGQQLRAYLASGPAEVSWRRPESQRTQDQNDRMWAMLGDVSQQVTWYGTKLEDFEWKDVFTAALKRHRVVPGIDGGFVVLGMRTSKMSIRLMSELIELMFAFGADPAHPVQWTDPDWQSQMREAERAAA
jgi:hypothetical protein